MEKHKNDPLSQQWKCEKGKWAFTGKLKGHMKNNTTEENRTVEDDKDTWNGLFCRVIWWNNRRTQIEFWHTMTWLGEQSTEDEERN